MRSSQNLLTRPDTFLGVCEGLGEDLRIPANLIRIAFAGLLFLNPAGAIGLYLATGLVIAVTRWFVPNPPVAEPEETAVAVPAETETVALAA
jgi:phage shock protein PspC (stress-responsive transcriptional regulator)